MYNLNIKHYHSYFHVYGQYLQWSKKSKIIKSTFIKKIPLYKILNRSYTISLKINKLRSSNSEINTLKSEVK